MYIAMCTLAATVVRLEVGWGTIVLASAVTAQLPEDQHHPESNHGSMFFGKFTRPEHVIIAAI